MANRYWVGGTATWDGTAGTKWSTTSGGTGGAAVPTSADDVFFDAASGAGTVTVSGSRPCLSFNATGFTGTLAGTSTPNLQVHGNLTLGSGMTVAGTLTTVTMQGTGSYTITSNGKSLVNITFNNAGDTWTLQDNLTITGVATLTAGTLALSSYTFTAASFTNTSTTTRVLNFGTGKLVLTGSGVVFNGVTTGFTTSGTTKIVEPSLGAAQTITPGALSEANSFDISVPATAGNFTLTLTAGGYNDLTFANATYTVANTAITVYGSLTINGTSPTFTAGTNAWTFAASATTETITTSGETLDFPITFNGASGTWQLQDALTVASGRTTTLTDGTLDLQSYTFTTGLFSSSNSNTRTIAFGTGKIVLTGTGTVWTTSTANSLTITGTDRIVEPALGAAQTITPGSPSEANTFDVVVPATAGNFTLTLTAGNFRNLTFADATYTVANTAISIFGNLVVSGTSPTFTGGANAWTFAATGSTVQTITTNGETLDFPITKSGATTSTLQLQDALSVGLTRTFTLTQGIVDLQSYTLTLGLFSSSNSNVRSIAFGTGKILLAGTVGATSWTTSTGTNFTSSGSKLVELTAPATGTKTLNFGSIIAANTLDLTTITGGGTSSITISGNVNNLTFFNGTYTITGSTPSIFGDFVIGGTSPTLTGNTFTFAATSGTKTITSNGNSLSAVTINGVGGTFQLADALTSTTFTFTNGTLELQSYTLTCTTSFESSNSNVRTLNFGTGKIVLSNTSAATILSMSGSTNFNSSGTRLVEALTGGTATRGFAFGTGVTEANTLNLSIVLGGSSGGTFNPITGRINNFTVANVTCALSSLTAGGGFSATIYGDLTIGGTNVTWRADTASGGYTVTLGATSGTKLITTNGATVGSNLNFNAVGGTWQLQSALTIHDEGTLSVSAGTLDLNDYSVSTGIFSSSTSSVRTLDFGSSSEILITYGGVDLNTQIINIGTLTNLTYIGTPKFALQCNGGTPSISATEAKAIDLRVIAAGQTYVSSIFEVKNISFITNGSLIPTASSNEILIYGDFYTDPSWNGSFGNYTLENPPGVFTTYYLYLNFASTSATVRSINTQNKTTFDSIVQFTGAGGSWRFDSNFTHDTQSVANDAEQYIDFVAGTLDLNGYTITTNRFLSISNPSAARTLTFGSGTLALRGNDTTYPSGVLEISGQSGSPAFTCNPGTGAINFTASSDKSLDADIATAPTILPTITNTTNTVLTFLASNNNLLFGDLGAVPSSTTYTFTSGRTYYFSNFTLRRNAGTVTLNSTSPGSIYRLNMATGIANCQRLNITDSTAEGGARWFAGSLSTDGGNNTGWIFTNPTTGNMFMLFQ
jgi:hypothetical protein